MAGVDMYCTSQSQILASGILLSREIYYSHGAAVFGRRAGSSTQIVLLFTFLSIFAFSYFIAHFILYFIICLFLFLLHFSFIPIFLYIVLHIIALSMERTRLTFHCWLYPV